MGNGTYSCLAAAREDPHRQQEEEEEKAAVAAAAAVTGPPQPLPRKKQQLPTAAAALAAVHISQFIGTALNRGFLQEHHESSCCCSEVGDEQQPQHNSALRDPNLRTRLGLQNSSLSPKAVASELIKRVNGLTTATTAAESCGLVTAPRSRAKTQLMAQFQIGIGTNGKLYVWPLNPPEVPENNTERSETNRTENILRDDWGENGKQTPLIKVMEEEEEWLVREENAAPGGGIFPPSGDQQPGIKPTAPVPRSRRNEGFGGQLDKLLYAGTVECNSVTQSDLRALRSSPLKDMASGTELPQGTLSTVQFKSTPKAGSDCPEFQDRESTHCFTSDTEVAESSCGESIQKRNCDPNAATVVAKRQKGYRGDKDAQHPRHRMPPKKEEPDDVRSQKQAGFRRPPPTTSLLRLQTNSQGGTNSYKGDADDKTTAEETDRRVKSLPVDAQLAGCPACRKGGQTKKDEERAREWSARSEEQQGTAAMLRKRPWGGARHRRCKIHPMVVSEDAAAAAPIWRTGVENDFQSAESMGALLSQTVKSSVVVKAAEVANRYTDRAAENIKSSSSSSSRLLPSKKLTNTQNDATIAANESSQITVSSLPTSEQSTRLPPGGERSKEELAPKEPPSKQAFEWVETSIRDGESIGSDAQMSGADFYRSVIASALADFGRDPAVEGVIAAQDNLTQQPGWTKNRRPRQSDGEPVGRVLRLGLGESGHMVEGCVLSVASSLSLTELISKASSTTKNPVNSPQARLTSAILAEVFRGQEERPRAQETRDDCCDASSTTFGDDSGQADDNLPRQRRAKKPASRRMAVVWINSQTVAEEAAEDIKTNGELLEAAQTCKSSQVTGLAYTALKQINPGRWIAKKWIRRKAHLTSRCKPIKTHGTVSKAVTTHRCEVSRLNSYNPAQLAVPLPHKALEGTDSDVRDQGGRTCPTTKTGAGPTQTGAEAPFVYRSETWVQQIVAANTYGLARSTAIRVNTCEKSTTLATRATDKGQARMMRMMTTQTVEGRAATEPGKQAGRGDQQRLPAAAAACCNDEATEALGSELGTVDGSAKTNFGTIPTRDCCQMNKNAAKEDTVPTTGWSGLGREDGPTVSQSVGPLAVTATYAKKVGEHCKDQLPEEDCSSSSGKSLRVNVRVRVALDECSCRGRKSHNERRPNHVRRPSNSTRDERLKASPLDSSPRDDIDQTSETGRMPLFQSEAQVGSRTASRNRRVGTQMSEEGDLRGVQAEQKIGKAERRKGTKSQKKGQVVQASSDQANDDLRFAPPQGQLHKTGPGNAEGLRDSSEEKERYKSKGSRSSGSTDSAELENLHEAASAAAAEERVNADEHGKGGKETTASPKHGSAEAMKQTQLNDGLNVVAGSGLHETGSKAAKREEGSLGQTEEYKGQEARSERSTDPVAIAQKPFKEGRLAATGTGHEVGETQGSTRRKSLRKESALSQINRGSDERITGKSGLRQIGSDDRREGRHRRSKGTEDWRTKEGEGGEPAAAAAVLANTDALFDVVEFTDVQREQDSGNTTGNKNTQSPEDGFVKSAEPDRTTAGLRARTRRQAQEDALRNSQIRQYRVEKTADDLDDIAAPTTIIEYIYDDGELKITEAEQKRVREKRPLEDGAVASADGRQVVTTQNWQHETDGRKGTGEMGWQATNQTAKVTTANAHDPWAEQKAIGVEDEQSRGEGGGGGAGKRHLEPPLGNESVVVLDVGQLTDDTQYTPTQKSGLQETLQGGRGHKEDGPTAGWLARKTSLAWLGLAGRLSTEKSPNEEGKLVGAHDELESKAKDTAEGRESRQGGSVVAGYFKRLSQKLNSPTRRGRDSFPGRAAGFEEAEGRREGDDLYEAEGKLAGFENEQNRGEEAGNKSSRPLANGAVIPLDVGQVSQDPHALAQSGVQEGTLKEVDGPEGTKINTGALPGPPAITATKEAEIEVERTGDKQNQERETGVRDPGARKGGSGLSAYFRRWSQKQPSITQKGLPANRFVLPVDVGGLNQDPNAFVLQEATLEDGKEVDGPDGTKINTGALPAITVTPADKEVAGTDDKQNQGKETATEDPGARKGSSGLASYFKRWSQKLPLPTQKEPKETEQESSRGAGQPEAEKGGKSEKDGKRGSATDTAVIAATAKAEDLYEEALRAEEKQSWGEGVGNENPTALDVDQWKYYPPALAQSGLQEATSEEEGGHVDGPKGTGLYKGRENETEASQGTAAITLIAEEWNVEGAEDEWNRCGGKETEGEGPARLSLWSDALQVPGENGLYALGLDPSQIGVEGLEGVDRRESQQGGPAMTTAAIGPRNSRTSRPSGAFRGEGAGAGGGGGGGGAGAGGGGAGGGGAEGGGAGEGGGGRRGSGGGGAGRRGSGGGGTGRRESEARRSTRAATNTQSPEQDGPARESGSFYQVPLIIEGVPTITIDDTSNLPEQLTLESETEKFIRALANQSTATRCRKLMETNELLDRLILDTAGSIRRGVRAEGRKGG